LSLPLWRVPVSIAFAPARPRREERNAMQTRILDLDASLVRQKQLLSHSQTVVPLGDRGPSLRIACSHRSFRRFEADLSHRIGSEHDATPWLSFIGSGDFHHVSLALLRRLRRPCNLLVIDNHPDWMRSIPLLHCGTWLYHAAGLPMVRRVFHVGGDVDFDNAYGWLAPWPMLRSGRIVVIPATRRFRGRRWAEVPHHPLRRGPEALAGRKSIEEQLRPFRDELAVRPLYLSLDKDVLLESEAVVNWDSGRLTRRELLDVLEVFQTAARGDWAGVDVIGDWSPVRLCGVLRRLLHWTEHPVQRVDADDATRRNEALNLLLLETLVHPRSAAAGAACLGEPLPNRLECSRLDARAS
jgi:hypothetical protein